VSSRERHPLTDELVHVGAPVTLRDGSQVRIRQGHRSDRALLLEGFERLSSESRYRRFLVPMAELTDEMVRYLTEVDHHDHEAMIALDEETGEGIGVAIPDIGLAPALKRLLQIVGRHDVVVPLAGRELPSRVAAYLEGERRPK
jgi:hypothetical protein